MTTTQRVEPIPEFDEDGLLLFPEDWSEAAAQQIATLNGIPRLTDDHWRVIDALRQYYARYGVAPAMSHVCRIEGEDRNWVHDLFDTCLNAWRVAGLPNPGEEAKTYLNDM